MFSALEILSILLVVVAVCAVFFAYKWQSKHTSDPKLQDLYVAKAQEAQDLHHTIRRFIPKQFIQHLGANHPKDLKVGFADEEDLNDGTINKVIIVADETKKTRGRKK